MPIDPSDDAQVASALLGYATHALQLGTLTFTEAPAKIGRGFDTYIYAFLLAGNGLPQSWAGPLVLRLYPSAMQADKAEREGVAQRFAAERGFPAVQPLALERNAETFGLPVMVMPRASGVPMLERIGVNPLAIVRQFRAMAELHIALHRLPVDGCPLPSDTPLVERRLALLREQIDHARSAELEEPYRWLEANTLMVIHEEPSLCHGDFHPLNILVADDGQLTVLDWSDAAVGDRHYDVGRTLALFHFAWIAAQSRVERVALRQARGFLAWAYRRPYARQLPLDSERLRYWAAFHALQGWTQLEELSDVGRAREVGVREDSIQRLPPELIPELKRFFWQQAHP